MKLCLQRLVLSHFRSHHFGEMICDGRPVVLFGANGAGKTNILEAVSLFSPGRGLRRAAAADMVRRPEALGWKLTTEVAVGHRVHELETRSEAGAARQVIINGKAEPQSKLAELTRVLWLVPTMDRLWIEGAEGRRRFLDRATLSFEPEHGQAVLGYEKAMRERNRLLKEQVRDGHWYGALEAQMAALGAQVHEARQRTVRSLMDTQSHAATAFPAADLAIDQGERDWHGEDDLCHALADGRMRDLAAGRTLVGPHRSDLVAHWAAKGIPARDCSTGEQKALLVSLVLANCRALDRPPLLLLDEVSAHLDADRRAALFDEICALGVQAWMTGTEPDVFAPLGARAQYFQVSEAAARSTITEVAP